MKKILLSAVRRVQSVSQSRHYLIISRASVLLAFGAFIVAFQNCGHFNASGITGATSTSALSSSSSQSSSSSVPGGVGTSTQDSAMIAMLVSAISPYEPALMSLGISSSNLSMMIGQTFSNENPSDFSAMAAQVTSALKSNAPTAIAGLSSAQRSSLLSGLQLLSAALGSYSAASLSVNALALQQADLSVLSELESLLNPTATPPASTPTATPAPSTTPAPTATPVANSTSSTPDANLVQQLNAIIAPLEPIIRHVMAPLNSEGPYGSVANNTLNTMYGVGLTAGSLKASDIANGQTTTCQAWTGVLVFAGLDLLIPPSQQGAVQSTVNSALASAKALSTAGLTTNGAALLASDIYLLNAFRNFSHSYYPCTNINYPGP